MSRPSFEHRSPATGNSEICIFIAIPIKQRHKNTFAPYKSGGKWTIRDVQKNMHFFVSFARNGHCNCIYDSRGDTWKIHFYRRNKNQLLVGCVPTEQFVSVAVCARLCPPQWNIIANQIITQGYISHTRKQNTPILAPQYFDRNCSSRCQKF